CLWFLQEPSCSEGSNALEDHCFNQACLRRVCVGSCFRYPVELYSQGQLQELRF
ncbi:unnamed protein product, partial [Staurois parvus]